MNLSHRRTHEIHEMYCEILDNQETTIIFTEIRCMNHVAMASAVQLGIYSSLKSVISCYRSRLRSRGGLNWFKVKRASPSPTTGSRLFHLIVYPLNHLALHRDHHVTHCVTSAFVFASFHRSTTFKLDFGKPAYGPTPNRFC